MTTLSYLYRLSACASLCATFLLQGVSLSQAGEGQPKLHCLAIGIQGDLETQAKHPDRIAFPKAHFARQDATKFAEAIQAHNHNESSITLLTDNDSDSLPTHKRVIDALQKAAAVETETLIVYLSSIGFSHEKQSYICLTDTKISASANKLQLENALSIQAVVELLCESKAKNVVLILDACRDPLNKATDTKEEAAVATSAPSLMRPLAILSSCLPNQLALEAEELGHSVFTYFLLEGLNGKADIDKGNRDGQVGLQELFYYASRKTSAYALEKKGYNQIPWIQTVSGEEINVCKLSAEVIQSLVDEFRYVSPNPSELSYEKQQAIEKYALALEAFGSLEITQCIHLLNNVIEVIPNHTEAVRLRALCYALSGQELQAIEELKKLKSTLIAKVSSSDPNLLGVRDPQNTSKTLFDFQEGDVIEITDFSPEGKNSRGQTIPRGKYLYVTRMKKEGTEEWLDAKGVIFADAITPTSRDQVARQTQSSQWRIRITTSRIKSIERAIPWSHYHPPALNATKIDLPRFESIRQYQKPMYFFLAPSSNNGE